MKIKSYALESKNEGICDEFTKQKERMECESVARIDDKDASFLCIFL